MSLPLPDPSSGLAEEQRATRALLQLLQQEQEQLIEASIDGLAQLTEQKAVLVTQLTGLAKRRHSLLAQEGFSASENGMRDWVAGQPQVADAPWATLLALSAEAKELNRINGMLIARHLVRSQTALSILQGKTQHGTFYGPDGQSTGRGPGRGLAIG